jgi:glycerate 2-kinase
MSGPALRSVLERAWFLTLQELEPSRLVFDAVRELKPLHQPTIIATGKAAPAMAKGVIDALGAARGLVVTTDGTLVPPLPESMLIMRAAHPIPDGRSVQAAQAALQLANTSDDDMMLVLISGGTSSLLCAPQRMSLAEKQAATDQLLRSGANIRECNTVRRHVSGIKGGRLAAAFRGPVHCMIVSDVVGGDAHDVGSGPACVDPTTMSDAQGIICRYLTGALASTLIAACTESIKPSSRTGKSASFSLLASPEDLARVFAHHLQTSGWTMKTTSLPSATAEALSAALVIEARALEPGHGWVVACEPTLSVPQDAGRGGRAGWVALQALMQLPDDVVLWAAASDGVDGTSGAGGACVSGSMRAALNPATVESHLVARNDAPIHHAMGTSLCGGPTGTNLTDVYAVIRAR